MKLHRLLVPAIDNDMEPHRRPFIGNQFKWLDLGILFKGRAAERDLCFELRAELAPV